MAVLTAIKTMIDIIKGGADLELNSKEGKKNQYTLLAIVAFSIAYLYFQVKEMEIYAKYFHKQTYLISFDKCIFIFLSIAVACFILMCMTFYSKDKMKIKNIDNIASKNKRK